MKINHNMSAVIVNNQLKRTETALSSALEKLSSGFRINHASDDAAGMAISNKMQAQIDGLGQASRNASDGVSVLQTADGALNEVISMIQRMRELSVQAANGTNAQEDKEAIQQEISALVEEIDRVSKDTEFNTQTLLDGTIGRRVYFSAQTSSDVAAVSNIQVSDSVTAKEYTVEVTAEAQKAVVEGTPGNATGDIPAGNIVINGVSVSISEGESADSVYEKLRAAGEQAKVDVFAADITKTQSGEGDLEYAGYAMTDYAYGGTLVFMAETAGSSETVTISSDNDDLLAFLGLVSPTEKAGTDAQVTLGDGFGVQATVKADGNDVTITDREGFSIFFEVTPGATATTDGSGNLAMNGTNVETDPLQVKLDVTDIGTMTLQIGANENQTMEVSIPELSSKTLFVDRIDVTKVDGPEDAMNLLDDALAKVSSTRSKIGAYENRLDYAVSSLDEFEENMTSAISRIEDTDMAEEMTEYTKQTVLQQAATSVLAQANDVPQQVLQLLQ